MSTIIPWTKLLIAWLVVSLAALGCSGGSSSNVATEEKGSLEMALTTSVGGVSYRLSNFYIYLSGPSTYQYISDSNPSDSKISVTLSVGNYTANLQQWQLERADAQGVYHTVQATLETTYYQSVTIYNGTTTTLTYSFRTDGVIVNIGSGRLDIAINIDVADAACTPLGRDCPSGSWCPPATLTGADLHCVFAGSKAIGQPCLNPAECVANASCFTTSSGAVCAALCPSSQFNQPCDAGGSCRPVASDYGYCTSDDAGAPSESGSDGGTLSSTEAMLANRGGDCLSCATENGCLDPSQFGGGTCESGQLGGHGSIDGTRSYSEMCLQTLSDIFASGCAATFQMTPCLCGTTDAAQCLAGTAPPNGPLYPTYVADFGSNINTIQSDFTDTTFGSGMANFIIQCVAAFGCECL
jgi:hypothetical protein